MKRHAIALAALAAFALTSNSHAASAGANLSVTAIVLPGCVVTTTPVVFGPYDPFAAADTNGVGTVVVACATGTVTTSIEMGDGQNFSAGSRRMQSLVPGSFLNYGLYQPTTSLPLAPCVFPSVLPWGALGNALGGLTAALSILPRTFNVCGTIPAGQTVGIGSYSDTVAVTVNF